MMHIVTLANLAFPKIRVTAARPGVVNFELEIEKHHTVRNSHGLHAAL